MTGRGLQNREGASLRRRLHAWLLVLLPIVALNGLAGCGGPPQLETGYGMRRQGKYGRSVNGLDVLAALFEKRGYEVASYRRMSPSLEENDVIIWAPPNYAVPSTEEINFLQDWAERGGTLIFIGRDYDAAVDYWSQVGPQARTDQAIEVSMRLAQAQARIDQERLETPDGTVTPWFTVRTDVPRHVAQELEGPWSDAIDGPQSQIVLHTRFDVPTTTELAEFDRQFADGLRTRTGMAARWTKYNRRPDPLNFHSLLQSGDHLIATEAKSPGWAGRILLVNNGSFLLNLPLANVQNQKLAGKLLDYCGNGTRLGILEGEAGGLTIRDTEPEAQYPDDRWPAPMDLIVNHFSVLGVVLCFALFPIFGRPRKLPTDPLSDFGKHVEAFGDLLQRTGDQAYAQQQLDNYRRQQAGSDSGMITTGPSRAGRGGRSHRTSKTGKLSGN